jgi:hypothetical protein
MGLRWIEREKTFRTGETVAAVFAVFSQLHYSDGEPVEVEAWPSGTVSAKNGLLAIAAEHCDITWVLKEP